MDRKIKIAIFGDGILETGFGRVLHSIAKFLYSDYNYDISWLGLNTTGDPHGFPYRIYPTKTGKSVYGYDRTPYFLKQEEPDLIFLLNDVWIIKNYLDEIRTYYKDKKKPPIVVYFPVDAENHDIGWYSNFDLVDAAVTYTEYGKNVASQAAPGIDFKIIPHGIDSDDFFKIDLPVSEIKKQIFPNIDELINSFIYLNANRNQARKRLDITLQAFAMFSQNKPANVKLYLHSGVTDAHINTMVLAERYGIDRRLLVTSREHGVQRASISMLNVIYNACDVGLNSGIGEGWGLTNVEHAVTGAPQIVPDHSACRELFSDCGLLVPAPIPFVIENICTTGYLVRAEDLAIAMEKMYRDQELYHKLSIAGYKKFTSEKYSWKNITKQWNDIFVELLNK
jgi:D-inositol-3-phosphate glycosyltransferase